MSGNGIPDLVLFCDESHFGQKTEHANFLGGLITKGEYMQEVWATLQAAVAGMPNGSREIKWGHLSQQNYDYYDSLVKTLHSLVKARKAKLRLFCTRRDQIDSRFSNAKGSETYFNLYFEFLSSDFGLLDNRESWGTVGFALDEGNNRGTNAKNFEEKITGYFSRKCKTGATVKPQIIWVDSKDRLPLSVVDLFLGAWSYRLNGLGVGKDSGHPKRRLSDLIFGELVPDIAPAGYSTTRASFSSDLTLPQATWQNLYRQRFFKHR
jgi:hypothetical protein